MFLKDFLKRLFNLMSRSKVSITGAIIVSILFPVLLVSFVFDYMGLIQNPYFGFLLYVVMAPLFVLGLILMFAGLILFRKGEEIGAFTLEYLKEQFSRPGRYSRVRQLIYLTVAITLVIVVVVGLVSYSSFQYTSSPQFCGQFCHQIMQPQYVAYQNSPHSKVACVECHLGKDAKWAERSRFTGLKQLFAVAINSYSRPILPPIKALRPGRKTCEQCHLPEKFHGSKLYTKDSFLEDEQNTRVQTVLLMKVGSGDLEGRKAHGIHWHVSQSQQVYYKAADPARQVITQVKLVEKGKREVIFDRVVNANGGKVTVVTDDNQGEFRRMDCIDCHNRPTHIFLSPQEAIDRKLEANIIPRYFPYIKRQAVQAITKEYPTVEDARVGISRELQAWYREHYPQLIQRNAFLFEKAVQGVIQAYEENVFPKMKVTWGTYKNFIGHKDGSGCFRCHGKLIERESGRLISKDCNLCHIVLAEREEHPQVVAILKGAKKLKQRREEEDDQGKEHTGK